MGKLYEKLEKTLSVESSYEKVGLDINRYQIYNSNSPNKRSFVGMDCDSNMLSKYLIFLDELNSLKINLGIKELVVKNMTLLKKQSEELKQNKELIDDLKFVEEINVEEFDIEKIFIIDLDELFKTQIENKDRMLSSGVMYPEIQILTYDIEFKNEQLEECLYYFKANKTYSVKKQNENLYVFTLNISYEEYLELLIKTENNVDVYDYFIEKIKSK